MARVVVRASRSSTPAILPPGPAPVRRWWTHENTQGRPRTRIAGHEVRFAGQTGRGPSRYRPSAAHAGPSPSDPRAAARVLGPARSHHEARAAAAGGPGSGGTGAARSAGASSMAGPPELGGGSALTLLPRPHKNLGA